MKIGDAVSKMTSFFGIKECGGCSKRKQYLNQFVINTSGIHKIKSGDTKMTPGFFAFKCRHCSGYSEIEVPDIHASMAAHASSFTVVATGAVNVLSSMTVMHECSDGWISIADFEGAKPKPQ